MVARLSLSYVPSLCLSSALSRCLCVVRVLCHMGLVACNKFFVLRSFNYDLLLMRYRRLLSGHLVGLGYICYNLYSIFKYDHEYLYA